MGPVRIVDGVIRPVGKGQHRYYSLQEHFNLPLYFARVKTADDALRFCLAYGPLGYDRLVEPSARRGGDPVGWVLAQARTVAFAWRLIGAAAEENWPKATAIFEEYCTFSDTWGPHFVVAHGPNVAVTFHLESEEEWANEPRGVVHRVLADLVNNNTKGISYRLEATKEGLRRFVSVRSLIEAIWWFVGQAALRRQEENGAPLYLSTCPECGSTFVAHHRRQTYCPPAEYEGGARRQSLCALRARARRWYRNRKQEGRQSIVNQSPGEGSKRTP